MNKSTLGVYDNILTKELCEMLETQKSSGNIVHLEKVENNILPDYLTRSLQAHILRALRSVKSQKERYSVANQILKNLAEQTDDPELLLEQFQDTTENLLAEISDKNTCLPRPTIPLAFPSLFTGATGSPQLGKELELEIASANRVDLLVSFIKNSGLNLLLPVLEMFTNHGGILRVVTTTYMGASDPTAIDRLSKLKNTTIKVNYDTKSSRLHAKAYFIHRDTGLSSAYIGSANLSRAAITEGLEWTLKISKTILPDLYRRCEAEFESYWESANFHTYLKGDLEKFTKASTAEKEYSLGSPTKLVLFDIRPHDYQQAVLDNLKYARQQRKHFRNLVVAATGTGKTMIAAFDYKAQCQVQDTRPKLLFIVHRKEILNQALLSFRQVIADGNFGELLVDGNIPTNYDYLFCSVASFASKNLIDKLGATYWDIVIFTLHDKKNHFFIDLQVGRPKLGCLLA